MARKSKASFKTARGKVPAPAAVRAFDRDLRREESLKTKGQTLRLNMGAWRELKILAIEQGKPAHALLVEAVNDLFKKYGKKSLA